MSETGQNHKSRVANQKDAFIKLANRLVQRVEKVNKRRRSDKPFRTYHVERNEVIDDSGDKRFLCSDIMGDITPVLEYRKRQCRT